MSTTLSRRHQLQLLLNVARGAEYLDQHGEYGWPVAIAALFPRVRIREASNCIVGTLLQQGFINGIAETLAGTIDGYSAWVEAHDVKDYRLGFNLPSLGDEDMEWEEDLNASQGWSVLMEGWQHEASTRLTEAMVDAVARRAATRVEDYRLRQKGFQADLDGQRTLCDEADERVTEANNALEDRRDEFEDAAKAASAAERARNEAAQDQREAVRHAEQTWDAFHDLQAQRGSLDQQLARATALQAALPALRHEATGWVLGPNEDITTRTAD